MSYFLPTTTVTIKRGSELDDFGDEVDANVVVASGVLCAVTIGSAEFGDQRTFRPSEGRTGVVESFTLRFRPNVHVEEQDRVFDERQGLTYQVVSVFHPQRVVGAADVRATAIRVAGVSKPVNG